ncbi:hypothetical protein AAER89_29540 [Klebsiella pneumoniae]
MNQKGEIALKVNSKCAMGQITSSFGGSTSVIFLSSRLAVIARSAEWMC